MQPSASSGFSGLAFFLLAAPLAAACGSPPSTAGVTGSSGSSTGAGGAPPSRGDAGTGADGGTSGGSDGGGATLPVVIHYVPGVQVSTLAGSDIGGTQDGTGGAAQFDNPTGMALDAHGNLVVTDYDSGRVRLVTPGGVVTTIGAKAGFVDAFASVVATDGTYYIQTDADSSGAKDTMTGTIWRVTPPSAGGLGALSVVAAGFGRPRGLAPMPGGDLFVMDRTRGVAEHLAVSSGQVSILAGTDGTQGYVDGTGASARFDSAVGAAALGDGSFLVTDAGNNRIRKVTPGGVVTTFAGTGVASLVDAPCGSAGFNAPRGVAVDAAGNVYVSDIGNHVIRRIDTACVVETVAGSCVAGYADGDGKDSALYGQEGIAVTPDGKTIFVADGNGGDGSAHHRVRAIAVP